MENHNNWQGSDPFTNTYSNARNSFYGISANPTAVFDGIKQLVGGNHTTSLYTSYLPIYQARYAIKTNFGITINGTHIGNNYNISVTIDRYGETPFANSNLVLYMALTQSHITYSWEGQTHLEFVNRLMAPDASGTPINLSSLNQVIVPLTFTFNTSWGGNIANHDYEIVAWVQDLTTKEIVDAQKYDLNLIPVGINNIKNSNFVLYINPNPASDGTSINFNLKETAKTKIEIYNICGQIVKTLADADLTSGSHSIVWDLTNNNGSFVSNGIYLCKVISGNSISTSKIFVER
jgi:hypothetical protein